MAAKPKKKIGGRGRPVGPKMPCGWCGLKLTTSQMRGHFKSCKKRPKPEKGKEK